MFNFVKMQALGNDFIIINKKDFNNFDIKKICDRHFGIGADGLIIYQNSNVLFFNSDSSPASTCGNGLRCIAKYLFDQNIVSINEFKINLPNRTVDVIIENNDQIQINMGSFLINAPYFINYKNQNIQVVQLSLTNNHLVVILDDLSKLSILEFVDHINNEIVHDANIEFVNVISKAEVLMRVWERGVGETKACGSGACASLLALNYLEQLNSSAKITMPGGSLECSIKDSNVYLKGRAEYVFSGTYNL